ncbi:MAG: DUF1573 domain-containing protein [Bacteriovoracaceae bacterium]
MTPHHKTFKSVFFTLFFASFLSAQPAIRLNNTLFTLGAIYHGEVKTVPLIVRNTGTQPLNILGVETSCGCTSAKRSVNAIAPGTEDTITVSFNSLGFSGSITKIVTVRSNDPVQPQVEARLTGTVTTLLETIPPMQMINLGTSHTGTSTTVSFLFRNTTSDQITIRNIVSVDTTIRMMFRSGTVAPHDSITIPFIFTPSSSTFVENYFYIETTDSRQPRIPFRFMYIGR